MKTTNLLSLLAPGLAFGVLLPVNAQAAATGRIVSQDIYLGPSTPGPGGHPPEVINSVDYEVNTTGLTTTDISLEDHMTGKPNYPYFNFGEVFDITVSITGLPPQATFHITSGFKGTGYPGWLYHSALTLSSTKYGNEIIATDEAEQAT